MPLLYKNQNENNMKKREELTRNDWELIKKHKTKTSYTNEEASELFNLVRTYVDPRQATCVTCTSNLRDAKTKLNEYYQSVVLEIDTIFELQEKKPQQTTEIKQSIDEPKQQVEDYSNEEAVAVKKRSRKKKE